MLTVRVTTDLPDVLPTTLDIAGAKVPPMVNGVKQTPIQGISLAYSFANAAAPARRKTQYYFLYGSGGICHDGWKASCDYLPGFVDLFGTFPNPKSAENNAGKEVWGLYNVSDDPTELNDLAKGNPAKLKQVQALFEKEAKANQVYPLLNWSDLYPRFQALWKAIGSAGAAPHAGVPATELSFKFHGQARQGRHRPEATVCAVGRASSPVTAQIHSPT